MSCVPELYNNNMGCDLQGGGSGKDVGKRVSLFLDNIQQKKLYLKHKIVKILQCKHKAKIITFYQL